MICFDTNIIIYLAKGIIGEEIIGDEPIVYPSIIRIEALGYHKIRSIEQQRIEALLGTLTEIPLNNEVIDKAIRLRQYKSMTLGDAIVAATAIEYECELWTANTADFEHIEELRAVNPVGREG